MVQYYAILDEYDYVTRIEGYTGPCAGDNLISIDGNYQYLIGMFYNRETGEFEDRDRPFSQIAEHSTDEINVGTSNDCLTDVLTLLTDRITALENSTNA